MKRVLLIACLVACQSASREDDVAGAKTQVQRFFEAIDARDCSTIGSLVPAASAAAACDKFLHEWADDLKIKLLDVTDVRRDGRDKRAIIVTTSVMRHGQAGTMLVRVTHEKGAWQLVL